MENLPVEIIEKILTDNSLNIRVVINFSSTCSYFHDIVTNSNAIWKSIYIKKWPHLIHKFEQNSAVIWYTEVKYVYNLIRRAHNMLADMPSKFYKRYELSDSDLNDWREAAEEHPLAYHYLVDLLMSIVNNKSIIRNVNTVPINTPGNLTYRYYANKVLRCIRQQYLAKEWETYMCLPPEEQILERGAVFIAQWCQPTIDITFENISKELDDIANEVRAFLCTTHPNHPIFSVTMDIQREWRTRILSKNQWSATECRQIMDSMAVVLYKHRGFYGNNDIYYIPENSFINEVLERRRGLPIALAILYEGVARRLGVRCEPTSLPAHFFLRWPWGPSEEDFNYIDVYNQGHIMMKRSCPHARFKNNLNKNTHGTSTAKQVMAQIANNLELGCRQHVHPNGRITRLRSVLELLHLIDPSDLTCILNLARLYMLYNMDVSELASFLTNQEFEVERRAQAQQIVQMLQDHEAHHKNMRGAVYPQVEVAPRTPELEYAVGMVMRHLRFGYTCVIYDWDPVCLASPDWQEQMNVHMLTLKENQPFYNVLVEDGSHRYVAQENIIPIADPSTLVSNEDLGSHFSHFYETHFVPNAEKEKEYPEDGNVRRMYHEKLMYGFQFS